MRLAALIRGRRAEASATASKKAEFPSLATATPATAATLEGATGRTVAGVAIVAVATHRKPIPALPAIVGTGHTGTASRWWLIHYPDREPVQVASFPPVTHAELLEHHPEAIAAEPINQAAPKPACTSCATCTHVTGRGGCGEPVAAGLSDVVGVIRYSPDGGATCPAWLARLDQELERRIRAMAQRLGGSDDDLAAALAGARIDPQGWWRVLEAEIPANMR